MLKISIMKSKKATFNNNPYRDDHYILGVFGDWNSL